MLIGRGRNILASLLVRSLYLTIFLIIALPAILGNTIANAETRNGIKSQGWRGTVRQTLQYTCGHALLASMSLASPEATTELQLVNYSQLPHEPLTLAEFQDIAIGISHPGVWLATKTKSVLPHHPVVLHLSEPRHHYVLLVADTSQFATIIDPENGVLTLSRDKLQSRWSGYFYAFTDS